MPEDSVGATIVLRRPERSISGGASRDLVEQSLSADPADLEAVRQFAADHGLHIDRESAGERSVWVSGTPQQMQAAFGAEAVPTALNNVAIAVLGLNKHPIAKSH